MRASGVSCNWPGPGLLTVTTSAAAATKDSAVTQTASTHLRMQVVVLRILMFYVSVNGKLLHNKKTISGMALRGVRRAAQSHGQRHGAHAPTVTRRPYYPKAMQAFIRRACPKCRGETSI